MNRELLTLGRDQHDDLEEVSGAVGAEHEPAFWILTGVFDGQGVVDCMEGVAVFAAVLGDESWNLTV